MARNRSLQNSTTSPKSRLRGGEPRSDSSAVQSTTPRNIHPSRARHSYRRRLTRTYLQHWSLRLAARKSILMALYLLVLILPAWGLIGPPLLGVRAAASPRSNLGAP